MKFDKSNPTAGDVHVNAPLTNISIAFIQGAENFIADTIFPNIPVMKQSDRYYTYDRGEFNRDEMEERAPATQSKGGDYTIDNTPTYYAPVYAFHKDIADQVRANADPQLNMDNEATLYVTQKGLLKREKLWATKFFTTGVWTKDITGVSATPTGDQVLQWNDTASTPLDDVTAAKTFIKKSTGFDPIGIVMGREVWDQIKNHAEIIDRIKYGQTAGSPARVTREAVAALMELERVDVMNAIENTANEGATPVHVFIGGKSALIYYRPPAPGLLTPSAGYTFSWTGLNGAGQQGGRIKRLRMEPEEADRIEIQMSFDQKVISADLGYFFTTIVA